LSCKKKRSEFLKVIASGKLVDYFTMLIDSQSLVLYPERYELFKMITEVKRSIVECGAHRLASMMLFAQITACMEMYGFNERLSDLTHLNDLLIYTSRRMGLMFSYETLRIAILLFLKKV
jgi:hypothetical protein